MQQTILERQWQKRLLHLIGAEAGAAEAVVDIVSTPGV